jgi:hypothetical protein
MPSDDRLPVKSPIVYARCTIIESDGRAREGSVNAANLMTVTDAVAALRAGNRAWVKIGDGDLVMASWHNYGDRG